MRIDKPGIRHIYTESDQKNICNIKKVNVVGNNFSSLSK